MSKPASYLMNCYLEPKPDAPSVLFDFESAWETRVYLDGYAIIPMERFHRLTELAEAQAKTLADNLINRARSAG